MPKFNTYTFSLLFFIKGWHFYDNIIYGPGTIYSHYIYDNVMYALLQCITLYFFSSITESSQNAIHIPTKA